MRNVWLFAVVILLMMATGSLADHVNVALHHHPTLMKMLQTNNELRDGVGLAAQQISPELTKAAQDHALYMARTGNFSHGSNGGSNTRAKRHGYPGRVRENIAMGHSTISAVFRGWRNSGGHWASIISTATDVGFGYAVNSRGTAYWVGVYGFPLEESKETESLTISDPDDDQRIQNASPTMVSSLTYVNNHQRRRGIQKRRL